jgi:predicted ribosome quality control (RQC) complex YloA/Tae2 family protein
MKTIKFREFFTSSGKLVLGGKDAESNEKLMEEYIDKDVTVLHTKEPGSPFSVIKNPEKKELKEAAVFTAKYSQDWKKNKKDIIVDYFLGKDVFKEKGMKLGTFGVKKAKSLKIKKEQIMKIEKNG